MSKFYTLIRVMATAIIVYAAVFAVNAHGEEANPDYCRLSGLHFCPDTSTIEGFSSDLDNVMKRTFDFHEGIILDPRKLQHTHCRVFLRSLFESLFFAASNITMPIHEIVFNPLSSDIMDEWDYNELRTIRKHIQNAESDTSEIQSSANIALKFIMTKSFVNTRHTF